MTRYRVITSPNAPGFLKISGRVTLNSTIVKPAAESRICYDEVVPEFKIRSARGEVFNNAFSSTHTINSFVGSYSGTEKQSGFPDKVYDHQRTLDVSRAQLIPLATQNYEEARAILRTRALAAVNATQFDAGTFAGEWHKTRSLFKDTVNAFMNALLGAASTYRKGTFKKIPLYDDNGHPLLNSKGKPQYKYSSTSDQFRDGTQKSVKNVNDLWLIVRYGVRPLLNELENALKLLTRNTALRQTARAQVIITDTGTSTSLIPDDWGKTWTLCNSAASVLTLRAGILYETTQAGQLAGRLGVTRLGSTVWELMPYSFVVDWFFSVGMWLDAIQPSGASRTLCAWESMHVVNTHITSINESFNGPVLGKSVDITWKETASRVETFNQRTPWVISTPSFPTQGSGFTGLKLVDFVALVLQKLL